MNKQVFKMKRIALIIAIIAATWSCSRNCPECYYPPPPFKLAILNNQGDNLLDPETENYLIIDKIKYLIGNQMEFQIIGCGFKKDEKGFCYLESQDDYYHDLCIDSECEFYISYTNNPGIDTINVLIKTVISDVGRNCTCTGYSLEFMKHNGKIITEYDSEEYKTGAAIIRK